MKKFIVALIGIVVLSGAISTVSAAEIPDEQMVVPRPPIENVGGYSGAYYDDQRTLFRAFTYVEAWKSRNFVEGGATTCTSALEEPCKSTSNLFFETPLSPCSIDVNRDCVQTFSGKSENGEWKDAELVETLTSRFGNLSSQLLNRYNTPFIGDPARGVPNSGYVSSWKIPSLSHQGGDEYLLIPKLNAEHMGKSGTDLANLDVGVFAVSRLSSANKSEADCFFLTATSCFIRWAHPEKSEFRVAIKTGANIVGWFHGRIYEPTIENSKLSDGQSLITVEGASMKVPVLAVWSKNSELPKNLDDMIEQEFKDRGNQFAGVAVFGGNSKSRAEQAVIDERNPSFNEWNFARYLEWVKVAQDKAYSNPSTWSFRTMESTNQFWRCFDGKAVIGMVTTNSNAYLAGPPQFSDGVLSYKVSSPHYDSKGNVQIGTYDLAIQSDVARCIYGFTSAPIQATISVIYDDGQTKSATTVVSERNGWLRLSAKGFTYSSPVVKVSLSQNSPVSSVSGNPISTRVATKKSIICVKGKQSKKVTAINPKCPAGYKKKAA